MVVQGRGGTRHGVRDGEDYGGGEKTATRSRRPRRSPQHRRTTSPPRRRHGPDAPTASSPQEEYYGRKKKNAQLDEQRPRSIGVSSDCSVSQPHNYPQKAYYSTDGPKKLKPRDFGLLFESRDRGMCVCAVALSLALCQKRRTTVGVSGTH
nr:unnamed protein product [Callosobruchus analis]